MGGVEYLGGWGLVYFAGLDSHQTVFHMVDTADRAVIERDDARFALRLASERNIRST